MALPDLAGKVALITGASRGIGAGLAEDYAARGMRLALCSRSEPTLPPGDDVLTGRFDVSDAGAFEAFAKSAEQRFGAIDLWINNAGQLEPIKPLRDVALDKFKRHIDVNLTGVFIGTQLYVRQLRARGPQAEGVLINISSGAAWNAWAGWGTYCAGKAGLERMTECVALEEADTGLRAYSVAPGVVDTAMQSQIRACSAEDFPTVEDFKQLKLDDNFNSAEYVAEQLIRIAFDPAARPDEVAFRIPYD